MIPDPVSRMPAKRDAKREERIAMEVIVDVYGPEEQAMGWYYYLEDKVRFPFFAKCIARRAVSPLGQGSKIEVLGMAPEDECQHDMFVETRWEGRTLAVPLSQIKPVTGVGKTMKTAIEDWHYWVNQGYEL